MKIVLTAGGTGGHIYPALSLLDKIKEDKTNEYLYIGTTDRMESTLIPSLNIPYESLEIKGFSKNIFKDIKNIFLIKKSINKCIKTLKHFKADAIIAFGGYVTFPVIIAAKKLNIKIYLHEQNAIPGKVNKYLYKYADIVFISMKESEKYFKNKTVIYSGNPCTERALNMKVVDKTKLGFTKYKKLIIIVMGSLGSSVINDKMKEFLKTFNDSDKEILFITGKKGYDSMKNLKVNNNIKIVPYIENLPGLMKVSDLIISRSGASTISEIIATNLPSILIPSPYVANNHQYYNALNLKKKYLSILILQSDLTSDLLKDKIRSILDNKKTYLEYKRRLKNEKKLKSSTIIYDNIKRGINVKES